MAHPAAIALLWPVLENVDLLPSEFLQNRRADRCPLDRGPAHRNLILISQQIDLTKLNLRAAMIESQLAVLVEDMDSVEVPKV